MMRRRWALVTGASAGLGAACARELALKHGAHLLLTARRADRLEALAAELSARTGEVRVFPGDLREAAHRERLAAEARAVDLGLVVLNAGRTFYGLHRELPAGEAHALLELNVVAPTHLVALLLPPLLQAQRPAAFLFVASLAGLLAVPYQALYSGTKAFLVQFGLALREELRATPISVTVAAPGGLATDMLTTSGLARKFPPSHPAVMPPERCARGMVRAAVRGRALYVPGALNRALLLLSRLLPRSTVTRLAARLYHPVSAPTGSKPA